MTEADEFDRPDAFALSLRLTSETIQRLRTMEIYRETAPAATTDVASDNAWAMCCCSAPTYTLKGTDLLEGGAA